MGNYEFANPELLWLLLLVPALLFTYYSWINRKRVAIKVSSLKGLTNYAGSYKTWILRIRPVFQALAISFLIVALARPQSTSSTQSVETEGVDIVLALDISSSMLAQDFSPDRLTAAKKTAAEFIENRPTDRIGLVIFSGESFSLVPTTTDHAVLLNQLSKIEPGVLEDGTAIGMGLATAVDRLRTSKAKSKVVILLTDGVNNKGLIDPFTAAEIGHNYGIRIYTIGVGGVGKALYPTPQGPMYMDVEIDEALMQKISSLTDGKYFRAKNNSSLSKIYTEIDKMERTKFEINSFKEKTEEFFPFLVIALVFICLDLLSRLTVLKTIYS